MWIRLLQVGHSPMDRDMIAASRGTNGATMSQPNPAVAPMITEAMMKFANPLPMRPRYMCPVPGMSSERTTAMAMLLLCFGFTPPLPFCLAR